MVGYLKLSKLKIKHNKSLKSDAKQLARARTLHSLANCFAPLNEAL
ncbi:hypothetical protein VCRA2126O85_20127 [Vibrio crassostreae]|nr:hypothetical protein VCRA2126O86_20127 [Vibrio crassostreae]CAK2832866.1 hypothetical protein VCRA2127O91_20129 [Vibrio crassostreae]CAK2837644.1 hypothetical protein VCRA2126O85_20127 [Vibrio crassostreae]CAK2839534.1 hypothetical protein VCRA2125O83_20131 [Vibrio crassostreae]CAK2923830.1 hypothetical protein VCRA2128O100_30150 [Vibrio crassostreae]